MKKSTLLFLLLVLLNFLNAQVGIGTASPNSNAVLDLTSTSKGLLVPRMTTDQRNAIVSPVEGLMIFNSSSGSLEIFAKGRRGERAILGFNSGNTTTGAYGMWQEFTPTESGFVTKITLNQNASGSEFAMRIQSGVTSTNLSALNGGKVIGYTSVLIPNSASGFANYDYVFSQPVFVVANTKYWFQISTLSGADGSITFNYGSDVYAGHNSYVGGHNFEPNFSIYLQPLGDSYWLSIK